MTFCAVLILLLASGAAAGRNIPFQRPTAEERASLGEKVRVSGASPGVLLETRGARVAVVATLGEKPTGGYEIKILKVSLRGAKLAVQARVGAPPKGAMVIQVISYPFDAVWIPASRLRRAGQQLTVELMNQKGQVLAKGSPAPARK